MKKSLIIIVIIIAIAAAGGAFLLMSGSDSDDADNNNESTANNQAVTNDDSATQEVPSEETVSEEVAATIVYTGSGFDVDNQTVPAGSTIEVVNQSDDDLDFASNVHPVHSDNSEFNVGTIEPGESSSFVVNQTGTWGFHNHLNSAHLGEITVE